MMRRIAAVLLPWLALACAPSGPPPAAPSRAGAAAAEPAESKSAPAEDPLALPEAGPNQPAPDASCPSASPLPKTRTSCPGALDELARALASAPAQVENVPAAVDAQWASLEACSEFPAGLVRALRAERQLACADALVLPVLGPAAESAVLAPQTRELLLALGLAGRLSRLVGAPPGAPPRSTKAELERYLAEQLFPWAQEQAGALGDLARRGARLRGYARGIVAIEAALADLRFVEMARNLPLPVEMQDEDVQSEYYAALDEALEPRKDRARDAALVALGEFSALGITKSERLEQARQLISRVFAGNRIVSLDVLLVPPAATCTAPTPAAVVAAAVDGPLSMQLLGTTPLTPELSTCLLTRGLPLDLSRRLEAESDPALRSGLARAHFELGRTYMKAGAFQRAAELYAEAAQAPAPLPGDELLGALSQVLSAAPENAVQLFRAGPRLPPALGQTGPIDEVQKTNRKYAGAAAFDAAYLRELTAPDGAASHFIDVATRYELAARTLTGAERALAQDRARAARATARALETQLDSRRSTGGAAPR